MTPRKGALFPSSAFQAQQIVEQTAGEIKLKCGLDWGDGIDDSTWMRRIEGQDGELNGGNRIPWERNIEFSLGLPQGYGYN